MYICMLQKGGFIRIYIMNTYLNEKESYRYELIRKLVEEDGCDTAAKKAAAVKLGCSLRTIDRLINVYKTKGKEGFVHKNRGRPPATKYDEETKRRIIDLYSEEYPDTSIEHFTLIVKEDLGISVSSETIRLWLMEEDILSPRARKKTRKKMKKKQEEELKKARTKKEANQIREKINQIDERSAHPRRERSKNFGEMVQMDASEYEWIKGVKWTLHLAIDDATSMIVGAYFDYQETLKGYYNVLYQILIDYGIPARFYTDRRTVFEYRRKSRAFDDEDTFTQFSYACHKLGIEIKTTSVPQAKGRIERANQTFQMRLPAELRRANVTTIEEANEFLKSYLVKHNSLFALQLNTSRTCFVKQPGKRDINLILSVRSVRTIDHGHTIRYRNKIYAPAHKSGNLIYLQEGMKVIMIETFDGKLMINVFDELYYAKEILSHEEYSEEFDMEESERLKPFSWNLPKKHSWRTDDFLGYLAKQKHRKDK